jgi:hypothetical protein
MSRTGHDLDIRLPGLVRSNPGEIPGGMKNLRGGPKYIFYKYLINFIKSKGGTKHSIFQKIYYSGRPGNRV